MTQSKTILMAMRNLLHARRRTLSTLLAVTVGLIGLTLLDGYITYSMNGLRESVIHSGTGHLQVVKSAAFFDEGDTDPFPFMLENAPRIEENLRAMPEVRDVLPALSFTAVAGANGKTVTVMVTALPVEQASRNLDERGIAAGADLKSGDSGRILVGRGVARKLGLAPGATLSLFALNRGGGMNTQSYAVSGATSTIIAALDNVSVFMDLADAKTLIGSDAVPQLIVFLNHTADTDRVARALRAAPTASPLHGTTIRTWSDLSAYYRQANMTYHLILAVARLIVLIVALFSISGTLSLSILERLREVGTLRAFGIRRPRVVSLLLVEGLILGATGALVGCAAGAGASALLTALGGIRMPPQPGTTSELRVLFTPEASRFFSNTAWVIAASAAGALFPGMLASRRSIAELLRAQ